MNKKLIEQVVDGLIEAYSDWWTSPKVGEAGKGIRSDQFRLSGSSQFPVGEKGALDLMQRDGIDLNLIPKEEGDWVRMKNSQGKKRFIVKLNPVASPSSDPIVMWTPQGAMQTRKFHRW